MVEQIEAPAPGAKARRSPCPIAQALDVAGDRWTLLLVRDLVLGKSRYSEFQNSREGVPTNILADRLKRMQAQGLIEKTLYQERPKRYAYALTPKGRALLPVLQAMCLWAQDHMPPGYIAPKAFLALKP
jgi:DNA-binding HxlR family transcriptional regulator